MAVVNLFPSVAQNASAFKANVVTLIAAGTPQQLASQAIPNGASLSVVANRSNTGVIFVADSSANALDTAKRISLNAGESAQLGVANANAVWFDGTVTGDKLLHVAEF